MADAAPKSVLDIFPADFGIDEEVTKRVQRRAKSFVDLFQRSVLEGWELGMEFTEVKKQLAHGYFIPWVETQIGLSRRTAQRLMDLYARDPEKRHVTLFESTSEALRLLPPAEVQEQGWTRRCSAAARQPRRRPRGTASNDSRRGSGDEASRGLSLSWAGIRVGAGGASGRSDLQALLEA